MKIAISAGEISGDLYGAQLVEHLKTLIPGVSFFGAGSARMKASGVNTIFDLSSKVSIGIIEALPNLYYFYTTLLKFKKLLVSEKPDALILIDSQGFNMPLASYAKSLGIKTIYFITPQEWLWGTESRVKDLASNIGLLISIFKKEHEAYQKFGGNSVYFGHPLLDIVKPALSRENALVKFNPSRKKLISIFPGSRSQEIKNVFPILVESARHIKKDYPDAVFLVISASRWACGEIKKILSSHDFAAEIISSEFRYDVLSISDLALCVSGTINLEASILGAPNIMVYKLNPLSYWIGKCLLKIDRRLKYFSMPNILLDKLFIPEFIQDKADPKLISKEAVGILKKPVMPDSSPLLSLLGKSPVFPNISKSIFDFI